MSFSLSDFKKFAVISDADTSNDSLILNTLLPSASRVLANLLATADTEPAKASGVFRFIRGDAVGPLNFSIQYRFVSSGLRFEPTQAIAIAQDKAEQDFNVRALETGAQYNLESSNNPLTVIPQIPGDTSQVINLGLAGGKDSFVLPESAGITHALYRLVLYFFENRAFGLKKDIESSVIASLVTLISKDRSTNISKFSVGDMASA